MHSDNPKPYGSYGNGSAMRVSACGFVANSLEEAKLLSKAVTEVTHNHPEGLPLRRQLPGLGPAGDKGVHLIEGF